MEKKTSKKSTAKKVSPKKEAKVNTPKKVVVKKTKTTKVKQVKKKRTKAFTLIELLAVIIILGVLMIVAIPAVTEYISKSRKSAYVATAQNVITGTRNVVNHGKLGMYDTNTTYYIPASYIKSENGTRTPYGDLTEAYIGVVYDGAGYKYYWISVDEAGEGIDEITSYDNLDSELIKSNIKDIDIREKVETTGIDGREKILILGSDGNWEENRVAVFHADGSGVDKTPKPVEYYADSASTTYTDYTDIGKKVFVAKYKDGTNATCIVKNKKVYCFRYDDFNYKPLADHIFKDSCVPYVTSTDDKYICNSEDINCDFTRFNTSGIEFIGARCASIDDGYYCYATVVKGRVKGVCGSESPFVPVKP